MLAALTAAAAACAAAASAAESPTSYRAALNATCRANTVTLKKITAQISRAQQANDANAYAFAVGELLGTALRQDGQIEARPIPVALRSQMTPAIRLLKTADGLIRQTLQKMTAGDGQAALADLKKISSISTPINKYLDAAGLRDCGSAQP